MSKPAYIDHIVLIVKNIEETEKFYTSFLGKPEHQDENQIAYKIGDTKIFFGLSFKDYEFFDKDKGGLNHLAFGVKSLEELKIFEEKLNKADIKNSSVQIDKYGGGEFIWFNDPDGYRLEFYLRPDETRNDFLGWIQIKKRLDESKNKMPLFKEGEIWWCSVGQNIGIEVNGKGRNFTRPVFIFKKLSKEGFLGIPMSTQDKNGSWYVKVKQGGEDILVVLSQTKVFSSKRLYQKIGELDESEYSMVLEKFYELFLISNNKFVPPFGGVVGKSQI